MPKLIVLCLQLISTESYDISGPVGEDPVWNIFADLHEYLERAFPLVYALLLENPSIFSPSFRYAKLRVTKVNTYGLVFHWQGSTDAKPILLTAHQGWRTKFHR